jgi:hypothetical protein
MAYQGINTGSSPNSGTGDSLIEGAEKINSNFVELYNVVGNGTTTFVGVVTQITAGTNVSISTSYGSVQISAPTPSQITTTNLNVSGVSTLGVVTSATYYGDASNITSGKWNLGADGSTHYQFTGPGGLNATADPVIYLARGQSYEFVNNMGAHPFEIRSSNGGSAFSTGVTNNAVSNGTLRFDVPFDAPNSLYYQCTSHAGMGGTVVIYPDLFTV